MSIRATLAFNFEEVRQTTTSQPDATLSSWAVSSSKMILSKMTYIMMGWCYGIALGNGELTHQSALETAATSAITVVIDLRICIGPGCVLIMK